MVSRLPFRGPVNLRRWLLSAMPTMCPFLIRGSGIRSFNSKSHRLEGGLVRRLVRSPEKWPNSAL